MADFEVEATAMIRVSWRYRITNVADGEAAGRQMVALLKDKAPRRGFKVDAASPVHRVEIKRVTPLNRKSTDAAAAKQQREEAS